MEVGKTTNSQEKELRPWEKAPKTLREVMLSVLVGGLVIAGCLWFHRDWFLAIALAIATLASVYTLAIRYKRLLAEVPFWKASDMGLWEEKKEGPSRPKVLRYESYGISTIKIGTWPVPPLGDAELDVRAQAVANQLCLEYYGYSKEVGDGQWLPKGKRCIVVWLRSQ